MDILLFQMDFFKSTMVFFSSEMNYNPDDTTHILRSVQRPCGHDAGDLADTARTRHFAERSFFIAGPACTMKMNFLLHAYPMAEVTGTARSGIIQEQDNTMIRSIVVDDEPYLRNSIARSIEETDSDFKVIGQARNGKRAFEMVRELNPDVVFLDIQMPVMDGIALLEALDQNDLHPVRVILSGYSDFKYAQKAIQYQVMDYILKPIHADQLTALLADIKERLSSSKKQEQYQYLNYLFRGAHTQVPVSELEHSLKDFSHFYCFYLIAGSYLLIKNSQFEPFRSEDPSAPGFEQALNTFLAEIPDNLCVWNIYGENQNEILVIAASSDTVEIPIRSLAEKLFGSCRSIPVPVTLIAADQAVSLEQLRSCYIDLKYFAVQNIRFSVSSLQQISTAIHPSDNGWLTAAHEKKLYEMIREKRYRDFQESISLFLKKCKMDNATQNGLETSLIRLLEILRGDYYSDDIRTFVDEVLSMTCDYHELENQVLDYIRRYSDTQYYQNISDDLPGNIREDLDKNFTSQISMKDIAAKYHVSPSYLSTLFKKTYGISPNEYIMEKRMTKAKDLLRVFPPINIKQISSLTGYSDPYYFSRLFKMSVGMSPTQYREQA